MRQADEVGRFMGEDGTLLAYFDREKNTLWISGMKESVPCQTDEEAWDKISLFEKTHLQIILPSGRSYNAAVVGNRLISDTNSSANWAIHYEVLPELDIPGEWVIYRQDGEIVHLKFEEKLK